MRNDKYQDYLDDKRRFLSFYIQNVQYGIDILHISEIIATIKITPIPGMPGFIEGVINLRGCAIPVVDLRQKFGIEHKEADIDTAIVISEILNVKIGFIVDKAEDVLTVNINDLTEVPHVADELNSDFIDRMVKVEKEVIMILDVEKMFEEDVFSLFIRNDSPINTIILNEMAAAS